MHCRPFLVNLEEQIVSDYLIQCCIAPGNLLVVSFLLFPREGLYD